MKRLLSFLLIFGVLAAGGIYAYFLQWKSSPAPTMQDTSVLIEPGTGVRGIIAKLQDADLLDAPYMFKALVIMKGAQGHLKAGEYLFEAGSTPEEILDKLSGGEVIRHQITIPEGWTSAAIRARILADDRLQGELPETLKEASILPETYQFLRGETREALLSRMQIALQEKLQPLWEGRADDLPYKTLDEALVLASIVEKETGVDGERGLVASVFVNRLRAGMPLQSDPTVIYAVEKKNGKPLERPLYKKDLEIDSPYNTYKNNGFPPSPIANPGLESIIAVLNPPKSQYYYFVATGTGGHNFSTNLAEHNANVAKYRAELRKQGLR